MTTPAVVTSTTRRRQDDPWPILREIAVDLTANLAPDERHRRLLAAVQRYAPCDSAALLRLDGDAVVPVATIGLVPEVEAQRFTIAEHPRIAQILRSRGVVRFEDPDLPDPFDGLTVTGGPLRGKVHACMGACLITGDEVLGVLAIDAMDPTAFDRVDPTALGTLAALGAAGLRTAALIEGLERAAARSHDVARDLVHESAVRAGGEILGRSEAIATLRREVELAARADLNVLVTGETGAGKEVVARALHLAGRRADRPLIYVNCAALPETIAESELFGHVRGAFTGAAEHRPGKFEIADGGTLFLDEIGELPMSVQPKLLRALQFGEIQRVGSDRTTRVDVRVIAATNRDLPAEVAAGRFRADLYHRLDVYPIAVPPLRDRPDDIALLTGYFLDEARVKLGLGPVRLMPEARRALEAHDWPGNVRELEHTVLRATVRAAGGRRRETVIVDVADLGLPCAPRRARATTPPPVGAPADLDLPLAEAVDALKRRRIVAAVDAAGGRWAEAARALGVDRGNLHRMARRLGLLDA